MIYIPEMEGKTCPQSGKPIDGCFFIGDAGGAINRRGQFDIYAGECTQYSPRSYTCCIKYDAQSKKCEELQENTFIAPPGSKFYVIPKSNKLAADFQNEITRYIDSNWGK